MTQDNLARHPEVRVGALVLRPDQGLVANDAGDTRPLQPQVMRVFLTLVEAAGRTLSKLDLRDACWDGRIVGDDAMERVIGRIRRVNAELGPAFTLETLPKVGYRLSVADDPVAAPPDVPAAPVPRPSRRAVGGVLATAVLGAGALALARNWRTVSAGNDTAGPVRIALAPLRGGAEAIGENVANGLTSALQAALDRVDGVALTVGKPSGADDFVITGDVAGGGGRYQAILLLRQANGAVLSSTRSAWTGPAMPDAPVAEMVAAVVGLVGPKRVTRRHAAYPRDPVAVRDIDAATTLLDRIRAARMTGDAASVTALQREAAGLVARTLALDPRDPGALVARAALARNGWTQNAHADGLTAIQRVAQARALLAAALLSDPNYPPALAALADILRRYDLRWDEAERMLGRALLADPVLVEAHWTLAYMLGTQGRAIKGLVHARRVARLAPDHLWRRLALPRLLYLTGRVAEARALYDRELDRDPANAFLIRELYLMHLAEGDRGALRRVRARLDALWKGREAAPPLAALLRRIDAATDALGGRFAALAAIVAADIARYDAPAKGPPGTIGARASIDELFIYAVEFAHCGEVDAALAALTRALQAHALYWPATLPYGPAPFPATVRNRPEYLALWLADPALKDFTARRRTAVVNRQMAGFLPDGTPVRRVPA